VRDFIFGRVTRFRNHDTRTTLLVCTAALIISRDWGGLPASDALDRDPPVTCRTHAVCSASVKCFGFCGEQGCQNQLVKLYRFQVLYLRDKERREFKIILLLFY